MGQAGINRGAIWVKEGPFASVPAKKTPGAGICLGVWARDMGEGYG